MALPETVYATFSGQINQDCISELFNAMGSATQQGAKAVHLLFQTGGGTVGDGIALYNYFRTYPLDLTIYNAGTVASIGVLAFLGVSTRYVSESATFIIHKSNYMPQLVSNAAAHQALAEELIVEDGRSEKIVKAHTTIPEDRWAVHPYRNLVFNAAEAVQFGLAKEIREFKVPAGQQVFNTRR